MEFFLEGLNSVSLLSIPRLPQIFSKLVLIHYKEEIIIFSLFYSDIVAISDCSL